jgi:hypothetical protein
LKGVKWEHIFIYFLWLNNIKRKVSFKS